MTILAAIGLIVIGASLAIVAIQATFTSAIGFSTGPLPFISAVLRGAASGSPTTPRRGRYISWYSSPRAPRLTSLARKVSSAWC